MREEKRPAPAAACWPVRCCGLCWGLSRCCCSCQSWPRWGNCGPACCWRPLCRDCWCCCVRSSCLLYHPARHTAGSTLVNYPVSNAPLHPLLAFCITLPGTYTVGVLSLRTWHPPPTPFPSPMTNSHCLKTSRPYALIFLQFQTAYGSFPCAVKRSAWGPTYSSFSFMGQDLQSNLPTGPEDERHRD